MLTNIKKNKKVTIIDRILPELGLSGTGAAIEQAVFFCSMLKQAGVDMFEVDNSINEDILGLSRDMNFIFRIKSMEDISCVMKHAIRHCIIDTEIPEAEKVLKKLCSNGIKATVEIRAEGKEKLLEIRETAELRKAHCIRITGLNHMLACQWDKYAGEIKASLGVTLDCCPENRFYSANAIALEMLMENADILTVSFFGYGGLWGYAATEEILTAAKTVVNPKENIDLKNLNRAGGIFQFLSGVKIPPMKPVLGEDIFKYESGIHADGIEKNPRTYEPFDPCLVGQERRLVVGKHSGRKAVRQKLDKLNVEYKENDLDLLLKSIRERSIQIGRSLHDIEILELVLS